MGKPKEAKPRKAKSKAGKAGTPRTGTSEQQAPQGSPPQDTAPAKLDQDQTLQCIMIKLNGIQADSKLLSKRMDTLERREPEEDELDFQPRDIAAATASKNSLIAPNNVQDQDTNQAMATAPFNFVQSAQSLRSDQASAIAAEEMLLRDGILDTEVNTRRLRSGYVQTASDHIRFRVEWPHLNVQRLGGQPPSYDTLTVQEFVVGYIRTIEKDASLQAQARRHLRYLRELLTEAADYEWVSVKAAHKQVLQDLELGYVRWEDEAQVRETRITALRRASARRASSAPPQQAHRAGAPAVQPSPCPAYQKSTCSHENDHTSEISGVRLMHICMHCFQVLGKRYPHPEEACMKKLSKNERPGPQATAQQ